MKCIKTSAIVLSAILTYQLGCMSVGKDSTKEAENTLDRCQDEIDNDEDGLFDCEDDECQEFSICSDVDSDSDSEPEVDLETDSQIETDTWSTDPIDTGYPDDTDTFVPVGSECTILIAGAIPMTGTCKLYKDPCEGGFIDDLPPEMGATDNCQHMQGGCCADTDQCHAAREAFEPALEVSPTCTPESGEGACENSFELIPDFRVGCPEDKPICCLIPLNDGDTDTQ